jgi:hypothetical protein
MSFLAQRVTLRFNEKKKIGGKINKAGCAETEIEKRNLNQSFSVKTPDDTYRNLRAIRKVFRR